MQLTEQLSLLQQQLQFRAQNNSVLREFLGQVVDVILLVDRNINVRLASLGPGFKIYQIEGRLDEIEKTPSRLARNSTTKPPSQSNPSPLIPSGKNNRDIGCDQHRAQHIMSLLSHNLCNVYLLSVLSKQVSK